MIGIALVPFQRFLCRKFMSLSIKSLSKPVSKGFWIPGWFIYEKFSFNFKLNGLNWLYLSQTLKFLIKSLIHRWLFPNLLFLKLKNNPKLFKMLAQKCNSDSIWCFSSVYQIIHFREILLKCLYDYLLELLAFNLAHS